MAGPVTVTDGLSTLGLLRPVAGDQTKPRYGPPMLPFSVEMSPVLQTSTSGPALTVMGHWARSEFFAKNRLKNNRKTRLWVLILSLDTVLYSALNVSQDRGRFAIDFLVVGQKGW